MIDLLDAVVSGPELYVLAGLCVVVITVCGLSLWREQRGRLTGLARFLGRDR
jgi:hypothetical protein